MFILTPSLAMLIAPDSLTSAVPTGLASLVMQWPQAQSPQPHAGSTLGMKQPSGRRRLLALLRALVSVIGMNTRKRTKTRDFSIPIVNVSVSAEAWSARSIIFLSALLLVLACWYRNYSSLRWHFLISSSAVSHKELPSAGWSKSISNKTWPK